LRENRLIKICVKIDDDDDDEYFTTQLSHLNFILCEMSFLHGQVLESKVHLY
jgi:hypothetical protein